MHSRMIGSGTGQVITGSTVSCVRTVNVHVLMLPEASVAVAVTTTSVGPGGVNGNGSVRSRS